MRQLYFCLDRFTLTRNPFGLVGELRLPAYRAVANCTGQTRVHDYYKRRSCENDMRYLLARICALSADFQKMHF